MLTVTIRQTCRCPKNHHYNPAIDIDGFKAGCPACQSQRSIYLKAMELERLIRVHQREYPPVIHKRGPRKGVETGGQDGICGGVTG